MAHFEQVKWTVSHDPCRAGDRTPKGAVPAGTIVHFTLRVEPIARSLVKSVVMLLGERTSGHSGLSWSELSLNESQEGYAGFLSLEAAPHVLFYAFRLNLADDTQAFYVPRVDGRATAGELVRPGADGQWTARGWEYSAERMKERPSGGFELAELPAGFQVTVFEPAFATPSWMPGAVMYQIFPDRFARGEGEGVREEGMSYHAAMQRPVRLHASWNEPVEWLAPDGEGSCVVDFQATDVLADGAATSAAGPGETPARAEAELDARAKAYDPVDFYGGTLEGIRQSLPYIASLGVEAIYLNPIFEARSNHRYDTADYEHIDPLLGSDEDFSRLAQDAADLGIKIVLDAVLSHTGDDSRYFNARGNYEQPGAVQGGQSPYFRWYDFECISGHVPYRCWWGDPTLPEVDEQDPTWQEYVLGDEGVLARWLAAGAGGYRLDVADELPDDVLARLRTLVKSKDPDAAIIGEVWEDATTKESYGVPRTYALGHSLDSVMNYPLRATLLGYALGTVDAHQLAAFLRLQQSNYPPQLHACLMNLLSSHDVERVRSVLALGGPFRHEPRKQQARMQAGITAEDDVRAAEMQRLVAALLYALPGMPCIYYGDERGLQGGGDPFCRATFPNDGLPAKVDASDDLKAEASSTTAGQRLDCGTDLTAFYRQIGMMRKGSTALRRGSVGCTAPHDDVLCVVRVHVRAGEIVVAAVNRSGDAHTVAFDASSPEFSLPSGDRWAVRGVTGNTEPFFASSPEAGAVAGALNCEDGIMRLVAPARSTVLWRIAL